MDGDDDGVIFNDSSASPTRHSPAVTNAVTKTGEKKFGTASGYFDGTSKLTLADSSDFGFGTNEFTIDFWIHPTNLTEGNIGVMSGRSGGNDEGFYLYSKDSGVSNQVAWGDYDTLGAANWLITTGAPVLTQDVWQHVAVVRDVDTLRLFIDGTQVGTQDVTGRTIYTASGIETLIGVDDSNYFTGYLDEFRISKNIARWTENFTPPTDPYWPTPPAIPWTETFTGDDGDRPDVYIWRAAKRGSGLINSNTLHNTPSVTGEPVGSEVLWYLEGNCEVVVDFDSVLRPATDGWFQWMRFWVNVDNFMDVKLFYNSGAYKLASDGTSSGSGFFTAVNPFNEITGKFRIVRAGNDWTSSYYDGSWHDLITETFAPGGIRIQLTGSTSGAEPSSTMAWDNLTVQSGTWGDLVG
jgi:hypothetical protein